MVLWICAGYSLLEHPRVARDLRSQELHSDPSFHACCPHGLCPFSNCSSHCVLSIVPTARNMQLVKITLITRLCFFFSSWDLFSCFSHPWLWFCTPLPCLLTFSLHHWFERLVSETLWSSFLNVKWKKKKSNHHLTLVFFFFLKQYFVVSHVFCVDVTLFQKSKFFEVPPPFFFA